MRISTIRTAIGVAAIACAMTSAVPAAHAAKNDGRYHRSGEAKRKEMQDKQNRCDDLQNSFRNLGLIFDAAIEAHDNVGADKALADSKSVLNTAHNAGCGWAARVMPPQDPRTTDQTASTTGQPTAAG